MTSPRLHALLRQCACSTAPEAAFWKGVVASLNEPSPNWGLDLHPDREPDSVDAFVYLVDTSSLWLAGAAIAPWQLKALFEEGERRGSGEGALSGDLVRAAACIAAASEGGDATASPEILAAFACAVRAVAASQAYAEARQHECPLLGNHHWMLLLYRLANGEAVVAIGHDDEPYHGMLERSTALECVQRMVQEDLGSPGSAINQAVKRAGGVRLAPELRRLKIA